MKDMNSESTKRFSTVAGRARAVLAALLAAALVCALVPSSAWAAEFTTDPNGELPKTTLTWNVSHDKGQWEGGGSSDIVTESAVFATTDRISSYDSLHPNTPVKAGCTFLGWSKDDPEGAPTPFEDLIVGGFPLTHTYYAIFEEAHTTQISITAPVAISFNGSAGYDIAKPAASVTDTATFQNRSDMPIYVSSLTCTNDTGAEDGSGQYGVENLLDTTDTTKPLSEQKIFSVYPTGESGDAINFKYAEALDTNAIGKTLSIGSNSSRDFTFRLNLTNTSDVPGVSAKVRATNAKDGTTPTADNKRHSLAKVTYVFSTYDSNEEYRGFYLYDKNLNEVYTVNEVKEAADSLSTGYKSATENTSPYYEQYHGYILDESTYDCRTTWTDSGATPAISTTYNVLLIGIAHDDATAGDKAGLTFMLKDALAQTYRLGVGDPNTNEIPNRGTYEGGWAKSELRANMVKNSDQTVEIATINGLSEDLGASDTDAIINQVPPTLYDKLELVEKNYLVETWVLYDDADRNDAGWMSKNCESSTTQDRLFLPSVIELGFSCSYSHGNWAPGYGVAEEGTPYEFWSIRDGSRDGYIGAFHAINSTTILRTPGWRQGTFQYYAPRDGRIYSVGVDSITVGTKSHVCPCFCL